MRLTTPLTSAQFSALMAPFAPFEHHPDLAVAVSGGRDTLALALLASEWAHERDGRAVGLIVDHGLRAGSAEEAKTTKALLERHGIAAAVLEWRGVKPSRGIQAAARDGWRKSSPRANPPRRPRSFSRNALTRVSTSVYVAS